MFERETMRAVGSVSFGGPPDESGAVLIGYAMYEQFEGHGYATEVVRAMIAWAFQQPGVQAGPHARAGVEHAGAPGGGERRDAAGRRRRGRRRRRGAGLRPQRSSIRRIGLISSASTTAAASGDGRDEAEERR